LKPGAPVEISAASPLIGEGLSLLSNAWPRLWVKVCGLRSAFPWIDNQRPTPGTDQSSETLVELLSQVNNFFL
jgi:hypothetical protein